MGIPISIRATRARLAGWLAGARSPAALPQRAAQPPERPGGVAPLGRVACAGDVELATKNPPQLAGRAFGVAIETLCTSLLVVGPPGSGKTESYARPIVEYLLALRERGEASVVVLDPKGTDFSEDERFDYTIELTDPSCGFSLFGGADSAHEAADRLASALLPQETRDTAFFVDSAKNALYSVLAPYHAANGGCWPTVWELMSMLQDGKGAVWQSVRDKLRHQQLDGVYANELATRERQTKGMIDTAASLVERLGLLDRPHLRKLLDEVRPQFAMRTIDGGPTAVRFVLPGAQSPDAVRILARLAISQFVQVTTAPDKNRRLFTGLVCDEASRFLDEYVVTGVRQIRSNNAGMVLLSQSLADIPEELRESLFGAVGGKAVFAGLGPRDAELLSAYWGTRWEQDIAVNVGQSDAKQRDVTPLEWALGVELPPGRGTRTSTSSTTMRKIERPIWSPSEIINGIPPRHCIVSLAAADGRRSPPVLIDLTKDSALPPPGHPDT